MVVNYVLLGKRIGENRRLQNRSQAELAESAALSISYISYIETAKKQVSLEALLRISHSLHVTVDELLAGNQVADVTAYQSDLALLLSDCTCYEKGVVYETAKAVKYSLRDNQHLLECLD